ncbi:MAG: dimethyl sulfoxide reductase anchor subunit [Halieaceae bacterium]|nr:dimethyl sulfoxide reductase anchor subunit [Halieaceae bacterium]
MKDRSLVTFTLLAQMAVGFFWVAGALSLWAASKDGAIAADVLTGSALLIAPLSMFLGLLASFLHLGSPLNAWRALFNLRSSWLSREVLFAALFAGVSGMTAALDWFDLGSAAIHVASVWVAALLGFALIFSMSKAYQLRTVPAWDTPLTLLSFFTTALLLGGLAVGMMLAFDPNAPAELLRSALRWIAVGAVVLWGVQLTLVQLWIVRLTGEQGAAARAAARLTQEHASIFRLRLALAIASLAAAIVLLPWGAGAMAKVATVAAFVLALVSAVLGRVLFYEARVRYGV